MGTFTTSLKLNEQAFAVTGGLDPYIKTLTVGQIRVTRTVPSARFRPSDPCYIEECMCIETGIGSGTIWEYGKNIFTTREDAERGVITHRQAAYKQRAERDAYQAKEAERRREDDLRKLEELKAKYAPENN